jgi:hypothetical protein
MLKIDEALWKQSLILRKVLKKEIKKEVELPDD